MFNSLGNGPTKNLIEVSPQLIGSATDALTHSFRPAGHARGICLSTCNGSSKIVSNDLCAHKEARITEKNLEVGPPGGRPECVQLIRSRDREPETYNRPPSGQTTLSLAINPRNLQLRAYLQFDQAYWADITSNAGHSCLNQVTVKSLCTTPSAAARPFNTVAVLTAVRAACAALRRSSLARRLWLTPPWQRLSSDLACPHQGST